MSLLGIDIGSNGCKVAAYTEDGKLISFAYKEYSIETVGSDFELSSSVVWECVLSCLLETVKRSGQDTVKAISVSSMADTFTPVLQDGTALSNSIMSFDSRAYAETREYKKRVDPFKIYQTTGMMLHPMHPAFKLAWLEKNRPEIFENAWKFLCYEDFILWKLGAEPSCSYSIAGRTMLFNNKTKEWDGDLLKSFHVDRTKLPYLYPSGCVVGSVSKEVAEKTRLPVSTKLVTGGFDQACCAVACGVFNKGEMVDTTGTNEIIFFIADKHQQRALFKNNFSYSYHVLDDSIFSSFGHMFNAGGAFKWYRSLFSEESVLSYNTITETMDQGVTNVFFLPYLTGMGTPEMRYDIQAAFYGLSLDTSRFTIAKAILEGINMELKYNIELISSLTNTPIKKLRALGGATKSSKWMQLKADVLGAVVESFSDLEAGAAGAAIIAGVGAGVFGDIQDGYKAFSRNYKKAVFMPDEDMHQQYNTKYESFKTLRNNLKNIDIKKVNIK